MPDLVEAKAAFDHLRGPVKLAFAEVQNADTRISTDQAKGMINCLGNLDCFFPYGDSLGELSQLGEALNRPSTRVARWKEGQAETLTN